MCKKQGKKGPLYLIKQTVSYNFILWRKNVRVIAVFILAFILCFLLSDKVIGFAEAQGESVQIVEPFIWTFGDSNSILLSSFLLLLLYADMPFITTATPFFLIRENRKTWVLGHLVYIALSTLLYMGFMLLSTCLLCVKNAYLGNRWSKTAAILAYSDLGEEMEIPVAVKALEMSRPYQCVIWVFILMLLYTLTMVFLMMFFHIWKGQRFGFISVFFFSCYGLILNPMQIQKILNLPKELYYKARVILGWISPLNHASFPMHNFGYDKLPRIWQSEVLFLGILVLLVMLTVWGMQRYSFQFKGTEG